MSLRSHAGYGRRRWLNRALAANIRLGGICMKLARREFLHLAAGAAALPVSLRTAAALDFPTRPLHIVTPYPPGASPDIIARLIAQWLSERLGQQVIVDNRPGGGGNIGTERVAKSPPDGY